MSAMMFDLSLSLPETTEAARNKAASAPFQMTVLSWARKCLSLSNRILMFKSRDPKANLQTGSHRKVPKPISALHGTEALKLGMSTVAQLVSQLKNITAVLAADKFYECDLNILRM